MESLTVADVKGLTTNQGTLSVFTLPSGGIVDDLIVTKAEGHLYVVSNAGRREQDIPLMQAKEADMKAEGKDVTLELLDDRGLLALQGPSMVQCLQPLTDLQLDKLSFMHSAVAHVAGIECRVTRYSQKVFLKHVPQGYSSKVFLKHISQKYSSKVFLKTLTDFNQSFAQVWIHR